MDIEAHCTLATSQVRKTDERLSLTLADIKVQEAALLKLKGRVASIREEREVKSAVCSVLYTLS